MKAWPILLLTFSLPALAKDLSLKCEMNHNGSPVFARELTLKAEQKNARVGTFNEFELLVSSARGSKIEIQLYNMSEEYRSYASGTLKDNSSTVELAMWTRGYLLEARCSLK